MPPSDSWTELAYPFASNEWLRERYRLGSPDADPPHRCAAVLARTSSSGLRPSSSVMSFMPVEACTLAIDPAAVPDILACHLILSTAAT